MVSKNSESPIIWAHLSKGAPVYSCEYLSDEDFFKGDIKINKLIFDGWRDESRFIANVHSEGTKAIKIPPTDLSYGWFASKQDAIYAFKCMIEHILECINKNLEVK